MAVKYYIRYFDIVGIEHRLDIFDDTYEDEGIQVDGNVTLTYSDTDDSLEAIRGQGLRVELEADTTLTFNDLWSEDEKTYKVEYYRNFELIFNGWLNPEGWFENWVNTNWIVTFDCVDGLGYLSDLSFVNESGVPITGRKKYIEILAIALQRTGLNLPIYTDIQIRYTGLSESLNILDNVYANTERYIKDDGETIMSCEEVIRDILEPFGAVLTSLSGKWYIYKPNQLYSSSEVLFNVYDYKSINQFQLSPLDTAVTIGNDGIRDLFHCNANQSIRNVSSVGAYRISYKYGLVQSLLNNSKLISYDGVTVNDITILDNTNIQPLEIGVGGITFDNVGLAGSVANLRTKGIEISTDGIGINTIIRFDNDIDIFGALGSLTIDYEVIICNGLITDAGVTKYYLQNDLSWGDANVYNKLRFSTRNNSDTIDITTPTKPEDISGTGYFYVVIYSPIEFIVASHTTTINEIRLSPDDVSSSNLQGEFHTFQRETKPSAKVQNTKEVATGDNVADIYLGTVYKNDTTTPTETWSRKGLLEGKSLLEIMGEETLRLNANTSRVFTGDVYGYFNYLSVITIDNLDGVFMPIKYSYDTKNNIISAEFKQIYGDELLDIRYSGRVPDYGNTVKPTII